MDQAFVDLFKAEGVLRPSRDGNSETVFRFVNEETGEIEVEATGEAKRYTLKPLADLFGKGYGESSIDWRDEKYMPLLLRIEEEIMNHDDAVPDLTDGLVSLTLDRMALNPATAPGNDVLCRRLQLGLRVLLSGNDYSKQEVKLSIRKIAKSVSLHTWQHGVRGYLDFIRQQFRR
ncbi:MAG: hypothetical protein NTW87_07000 [Planctomycetota bacterium]|nr:hypothetical protein [Planctomycetota bacterium]